MSKFRTAAFSPRTHLPRPLLGPRPDMRPAFLSRFTPINRAPSFATRISFSPSKVRHTSPHTKSVLFFFTHILSLRTPGRTNFLIPPLFGVASQGYRLFHRPLNSLLLPAPLSSCWLLSALRPHCLPFLSPYLTARPDVFPFLS